MLRHHCGLPTVRCPLFCSRVARARRGGRVSEKNTLAQKMVLSPGSCHAYEYEIPSLRVHREPWMPAWHPGYVQLVYTERPREPEPKRKRELALTAALKRVRYCQKAPADWVHPWVLAARTGCVQKPK